LIVGGSARSVAAFAFEAAALDARFHRQTRRNGASVAPQSDQSSA
jgi:hypothetical protein